MTQQTAEARGRVMIRPWRIGLLVEPSSGEQVREAISNLSNVWGGRFMPIFDIGTPLDELERLANQFDVDSLYADVFEGPLADFLRKPGLAWRGRGPHGPFGQEEGLRTGLLPARSFIDAATDLVLPTWEPGDSADLVLAATWGLADKLGVPLSIDGRGPRTVAYQHVIAPAGTGGSLIGTLAAGALHIRPEPRAYLDGLSGVCVTRPDHPGDVVEYWNMRTYGTRVSAVPAEGSEDLVRFLLVGALPGAEPAGANTDRERVLTVWGLGHASTETAAAIEDAARRRGLTVRSVANGDWPRFVFQGLRTPFTRPIRADFRPEARWIDVDLPTFPIRNGTDSYFPGVVAAEVGLHEVRAQDPRLTASLPPYRRHASLIERDALMAGVDHVRVTDSGIALGTQANSEYVRVPFAYNQDVLRLLFDDDSVAVAQSDVGKFQSRAAEMLGGPFGGVSNQPGIRAAVMLAAGKSAGVPLQRLRQIVERESGEWPGLLAGRTEPKEYAHRQVNYLFHSGIFIPTFKVQCGHCRVESHVPANDLGSTMTCEFCGQTFSLALSHGLTQPEWRYRLAAHLRPDQVQALLPALATTSLLGQLRHSEEPPLSNVLGLEVTIAGRKIEIDVAVYLPDRDWAVVLGEVKTANKIDENDIANLEFLRDALLAKGVRCLLAFSTLKDAFSPEEVSHLRALIERSRPVILSSGVSLPNLPLVLTGLDLSHHPMSEDHPWRWDSKNYSGVFGTAITSCERNLGLKNCAFDNGDAGMGVRFEWAEDVS
jgi:hypothetical protein